MLYRFGDLVLTSNLELPELLPAADAPSEIRFAQGAERLPDPVTPPWFHQCQTPDGRTSISFARQGPDYLLRFNGMADFLVSENGADIACHAQPGLPLTTLRHLLLDQVMPLVLARRGRLVLHASAVALPEGAVGFLGETGRGKSTIAASFAGEGHPLISDDCLIILERNGGLEVISSYPGMRLLPNVIPTVLGKELPAARVAHYTYKQRIGPNDTRVSFAESAVPLRRLYCLARAEEVDPSSDVTITRLAFGDAFIALVQAAFQLDCHDKARLRGSFEACGRVSRQPLLHRLAYPRELSLLPRVREAVLANLVDPA